VFKLTARARLRYDDCFSDIENNARVIFFFSFFSSKRQLAVVTRRSDPKQKKREKRDLFFFDSKKRTLDFVCGEEKARTESVTNREKGQTDREKISRNIKNKRGIFYHKGETLKYEGRTRAAHT
jgi:hypothetical protein